ncbi:RICIN domain-containing protein [Bacteroidales bacterium OttesenSCG-928-I14]|nr:RICIN domain-containing protein [Bacteroidales bacterium OttesenSCG-928-I14]
MRKILLLFIFMIGFSSMYAGPWVIGTNQIDAVLSSLEQGTGETPPTIPSATDANLYSPIVTLTPEKVSLYPTLSSHFGVYMFEWADKGYKQKDATTISLVQPAAADNHPVDYMDRNDIRWLKKVDFTNNDFSDIKIAGDNVMALEEVLLSGNPNLKNLEIKACSSLNKVDIRSCNLGFSDIVKIKEQIDIPQDMSFEYEYQGMLSYPFQNVDLSELLKKNGEGTSLGSWSVEPESKGNNIYSFPVENVGDIVSLTLVNSNYPGMNVKYDIELTSSTTVAVNTLCEFAAIDIKNLTSSDDRIYLGDELLITVYPYNCSVFKSFKIDGEEKSLDANNQYRLTTEKTSYSISAIGEEADSNSGLTTNYLRNGSFEYGLNFDWEYIITDDAKAEFTLSQGSKIFDEGSVQLRVDVNSIKKSKSVGARTKVTVGCDSLYLLQFWAIGAEESEILVEIEGAEQKSVLFQTRRGNDNDKGKAVAFHYPFKLDKNNYNKELTITFYFQDDETKEKSNDPNDCYITTSAGATYYIDGLVLVDQSNDMHHDVWNTYMWNYNQVANSNGQAWTAGDNDVSFDLPDGRRMWIFNDSFYGNNRPNTNVFPGGTFVRNAVVVQEVDGTLNSFPVTNQGGQWTYFRIPDEDVIYNEAGKPSSGVKNIFWVGDALLEDGEIKVYLIEVYGEDRSYLGKFSYPELEFLGIEKQESFCKGYEKFFVEDGMIYLYANAGSGWDRWMKAARAELGDMNGKKGTWRFWDGEAWNEDANKASIVSRRGADDVIKLGEGNYAQLSMPAMSPEVYINFAPSPEGPWGHETLVATGDRSANYWYYMPNYHGQLANGKYSISLSANYHGCLFFCKDCENKLYTDKYWYRPRYLQVDLLALSPYTTNMPDCAGVEGGEAYYDECGTCVGGTTGLEACITGTLILYSDSDYSGKGIGLSVGKYTSGDLLNLGFEINTLSSFSMDEGYIVELYPSDNFEGTAKVLSAGINNLEDIDFDNSTNSLILRRKSLDNVEGIYAIQNKQSELYLGLEGNKTNNGAIIIQKQFSGKDNQLFELKKADTGYYTVTNIESQKMLNIAYGNKEPKTFVELWDGKGYDFVDSTGIITAQYDDSPNNEGVGNLVDKKTNTKFLTYNKKAWVQYQADKAYVINRYCISSANDASARDPRSWVLSGSNDGETWTVIDEIAKNSFSGRQEEKSFDVETDKAYSYFRIEMQSATGLLQFSEWKLFAKMGDRELTDSPQFAVQDAGNGFVKFINKASDMQLEVLDGFIESGIRVWQNYDYGQQGGLWKLCNPNDIDIVSIDSVNEIDNLLVYPNPASDIINIQIGNSETINLIVISDLSGKTIFSQKYDDSQISIISSSWANGIYLMKIYTDKGIYSRKVIKF